MTNKIRTEEEILKDFEELGYKVIQNNIHWFILEAPLSNNNYVYDYKRIVFNIKDKSYIHTEFFTMQEHKLLTELFTIWWWL